MDTHGRTPSNYANLEVSYLRGPRPTVDLGRVMRGAEIREPFGYTATDDLWK